MVVERSANLPPNGVGGGRTTTTTYQPVQVKIAQSQQQQQQQQSQHQSVNNSLLMKSSSASGPAVPVGENGQVQQTCNCCPYGYHIDRDFVRFCESYRTPDGQIYQRTVKSRLVMPWDPPLGSSDPDNSVPEDDEEDVEIEIDGEIAYMHVERVVTETLEDAPQLAEYYQWSPDVPVPVMQKFRTVHESRHEEEGVVNLHHTEHATYEMKPPQPQPVSTATVGVETEEVYLRNTGCQAEIDISAPKQDASTGAYVDRREAGSSAIVPLVCSGFGNGDIRAYRDPPVLRSVACGDGGPRQRDASFGNARVDKLPYVDPQLRCIGANYDSDAPWIKTHAQASIMAGPSFFRGFSEKGLQADLLPKPPKMNCVGTQFDKNWGTVSSYAGDDGPRNICSVSVQAQPEVCSRTIANPWPDIKPITYEAATEAAIDPDFIEKETCSVNFANSFETILRAIYEHQIINKEDVMAWLQEALYKEVKSSEVQVDTDGLEQPKAILPPPVPTETTSCQTTISGSADGRVASGLIKNHGTQVRPKTAEAGSWTDRAVCLAASTGTEAVEKVHKQTTTQPAITYTVGTSTDDSFSDGLEYRHLWSRSAQEQLKPPVIIIDQLSKSTATNTDSSRSHSPSSSHRTVEIPVQTISTTTFSTDCIPQPALTRPVPQLMPMVRPKKPDTVKIDIDARIRQFEQQISLATAPTVEPVDTDHIPRRPIVPIASASSEEDMPRQTRAKPEARPTRPHVEVIGIKPAGRDIGLLESAVRYRSSSTSLASSSRPLKSCLKKAYSEIVGPDQLATHGGGEVWGSSDEALSKNSPNSDRRISFSDKVQETLVSPALTDDEEASSSDSERRRKGMSDSDDSIDEGTYRLETGQSRVVVASSSSSSSGSLSSSSSGRNIRETYSLPHDVLKACEVYANHLTGVNRRPEIVDTLKAVIGGSWFAAVDDKDADPYQVEDYMSSFKAVSPVLLGNIATMADDSGNTALHYAFSQGNFKIVSLLLDVPAVFASVDTRNYAGCSALMLASLTEPQTAEQREVLTRMFKAGNVNIQSNSALQTPLMLSSANGCLAIVDLLLRCGADPNMRDSDGSTALMTATEHGFVEIVRRLLQDPRTDPYITDVEKSTALSIALNKGFSDIALQLYGKMDFTTPHPRQTSESKTEETSVAASSSVTNIPVIRQTTATRTTSHHQHASSSLPFSSLAGPLSPSRVHPRAPMRPSSSPSSTLIITSPRTSRRARTIVTTESTSC